MELRAIIESCGMKQADVARAWNVPVQNIVQVCKSNNPNYQTLKKLAETLNLSVAELVAMMEDKNYAYAICPECGAKLKIYIEKEENKPAKADLQAE